MDTEPNSMPRSLKLWCGLFQRKDGFNDHAHAYNDAELAQALQHDVDSVHGFSALAQGKGGGLHANQDGSGSERVFCVLCWIRALEVDLCAKPSKDDQNTNHWNLSGNTGRKVDHALDFFQAFLDLSFDARFPLWGDRLIGCLLYTSPSPRDQRGSRMPSSA